MHQAPLNEELGRARGLLDARGELTRARLDVDQEMFVQAILVDPVLSPGGVQPYHRGTGVADAPRSRSRSGPATVSQSSVSSPLPSPLDDSTRASHFPRIGLRPARGPARATRQAYVADGTPHAGASQLSRSRNAAGSARLNPFAPSKVLISLLRQSVPITQGLDQRRVGRRAVGARTWNAR